MGNGGTASTQTPPPTTYATAGPYNVKLVVTDARNCKDSVTTTITVSPVPCWYWLIVTTAYAKATTLRC